MTVLDALSTAFLFPGQGSQAVGMGQELSRSFRVARQTFTEADDILGYSLSGLMFDGPEETLTSTQNAQPALFVAGIAALRVIYNHIGEDFTPAMLAGHSLGELTALTAAGAMSFPDGLKLVKRRGELMHSADQHSPGGMVAILGLDTAVVETACQQAQAQTGGIVVLANDNCPGQIVIAGDELALTAAMDLVSDAGARKVVRLAVSIAAHSPLMERVQQEFRQAVAKTPFHPPQITIVGNTQAQPLSTVEQIRAELADQLTSPVRWTESVQTMLDGGIKTFVEIGSKDVLIGLVKRIDRSSNRLAIDSPQGIDLLQ